MTRPAAYSPPDDGYRDGDGPESPSASRRRLVTLVLVAVVGAALALTWVVAFSSLLGVHSVRVVGVRTLTSAQVERAAAIESGTPLARLDTAAVAGRVEKLADVASAEVDTSYPTTVVITVHERTPVGFVRLAGKDMLVDRTGDQYRTVPGAPPELPRFVVPAGTDSRTTGGAVATVAGALSAALRTRIASIEALDPTAITLVLRDGGVVRWGSADRSADKARLLPVLLRQTASQYDVSDPDQPFTR
ncbi:MAG TPA: FtsQ-type POTRA domain-containing protein [Jatrophihabitans sp.]|jgi:cell division protein FtsQ|uniref:cell division protein FtsQ/DivIB n=1 Tax=Jatrophihabitans sp. TaxID=1932789 RepID=UPI002DF934B1|nr:FtsQ-type POTRA domain-containing protein [Jatrophihabitans sp.]